MMVLAPTKFRPRSIACPTPPQPSTTAVSPGRTRAVLITAPTPVVTAHPISAATGKGTSRGIGTAADSGTTVASAKVPSPRNARTGVASRRRKPVVPSGSTWSRALVPVHSQASPRAQCSHRRQGGEPGEDDVVAGTSVHDVGPDGLDDAGPFVAQD